MCFSYYCSQTAEIFLLVHQNNRPLQQSGNSGDGQLRSRSLFCSGSDPAWGVWRSETAHRHGQKQGTGTRAVHLLFGRGSASWSKKIFYQKMKKKKCTLRLIISHLPAPGTVQEALWRAGGANTQTPVVWTRVGISSYFMRSAWAFALTLERSPHNHPGVAVEAQTRTVKENGHVSVFCPGLSHSCSFVWAIQPVTKAEEHRQRSCAVFPSAFLFCWLRLTMAGLPAACTDNNTSGTAYAKLSMVKVL